jgi:hypothetical protein
MAEKSHNVLKADELFMKQRLNEPRRAVYDQLGCTHDQLRCTYDQLRGTYDVLPKCRLDGPLTAGRTSKEREKDGSRLDGPWIAGIASKMIKSN